MKTIESVREDEYAELDRWFSKTPMGMLFYAANGGARAISDEDAENWKRKGRSKIDQFLADTPSRSSAAILFCGAAGLIIYFVSMKMGMDSPALTGALIAFAITGPALWQLYGVWQHTQEMRRFRDTICASLGSRVVLPRELSANYARPNYFRYALYIWTSLIVGMALAAEPILSVSHQAGAPEPMGDIVPILAPWAMGAVAIAWGLHWASKRFDRHQRAAQRLTHYRPNDPQPK